MARIKKAATPGFDPEILLDELTRVINWESKKKSSLVLLIYLLFVWFFQPWMLTVGLLVPFIQVNRLLYPLKVPFLQVNNYR